MLLVIRRVILKLKTHFKFCPRSKECEISFRKLHEKNTQRNSITCVTFRSCIPQRGYLRYRILGQTATLGVRQSPLKESHRVFSKEGRNKETNSAERRCIIMQNVRNECCRIHRNVKLQELLLKDLPFGVKYRRLKANNI
jgi:hypothetical protein